MEVHDTEAEEVKDDTNVKVESPAEPRYKTFERVCENPQCGKDFVTTQFKQRFCSDKCRWASRSPRKNSTTAPEAKPGVHILPTPKITGLPTHLQMAFDILNKNSSTYEKWYLEEKGKREALEDEKTKLQKQISDIEHQQVLNGIEDSKPSMFERVLNGIPPDWREHMGPAIGQLAMALVSKITPGPVDGTEGQLDDAQTNLLAWISSLPDNSKQTIMQIFGSLSQMDEPQFNEVLPRIINAITNGNPMRPAREERMYGN